MLSLLGALWVRRGQSQIKLTRHHRRLHCHKRRCSISQPQRKLGTVLFHMIQKIRGPLHVLLSMESIPVGSAE